MNGLSIKHWPIALAHFGLRDSNNYRALWERKPPPKRQVHLIRVNKILATDPGIADPMLHSPRPTSVPSGSWIRSRFCYHILHDQPTTDQPHTTTSIQRQRYDVCRWSSVQLILLTRIICNYCKKLSLNYNYTTYVRDTLHGQSHESRRVLSGCFWCIVNVFIDTLFTVKCI